MILEEEKLRTVIKETVDAYWSGNGLMTPSVLEKDIPPSLLPCLKPPMSKAPKQGGP
jgi:hypothetical protein